MVATVSGDVDAAAVFYRQPGKAATGNRAMVPDADGWSVELDLFEGEYEFVVAVTGEAGAATRSAGPMVLSCRP